MDFRQKMFEIRNKNTALIILVIYSTLIAMKFTCLTAFSKASMPVLALTLIIIQLSSCSCKASLDVYPKRTQTTTEFTLKGKGFPANTQIHLSVANQPEPLPADPVSLGQVVNSDQKGEFESTWSVNYRPAGTDTQTRKPWFSASDQKGCNGVKDVSSAYWFAN